jgi:hypothetical protein
MITFIAGKDPRKRRIKSRPLPRESDRDRYGKVDDRAANDHSPVLPLQPDDGWDHQQRRAPDDLAHRSAHQAGNGQNRQPQEAMARLDGETAGVKADE